LKPVSLEELSDQARLIWLAEAGEAASALGATGVGEGVGDGVGVTTTLPVVAPATFE
jgi:hypothetical protein